MYPQDRPEVTVSRDCPAVSVPYGAPVTIEAGCTATITQQLGGSYTVMVEGNLYRVDGVDGDALGFEPLPPAYVMPDGPVSQGAITDAAWAVLGTCFDPEIPIDIVNLGLIYGCEVTPLDEAGTTFRIDVRMTLTAPGCGMGTMIADEARTKLLGIPGVEDVIVDLVWDPPWGREMMSESARLQLGMW